MDTLQDKDFNNFEFIWSMPIVSQETLDSNESAIVQPVENEKQPKGISRTHFNVLINSEDFLLNDAIDAIAKRKLYFIQTKDEFS